MIHSQSGPTGAPNASSGSRDAAIASGDSFL